MNTVATEARLLTPAELQSVSGGTDTRGVNELVDWNNVQNRTSDGMYAMSNGYMLADYNLDRVYDVAWQTDGNGGWLDTTDGNTWSSDDGPTDEWSEHEAWLHENDSK